MIDKNGLQKGPQPADEDATPSGGASWIFPLEGMRKRPGRSIGRRDAGQPSGASDNPSVGQALETARRRFRCASGGTWAPRGRSAPAPRVRRAPPGDGRGRPAGVRRASRSRAGTGCGRRCRRGSAPRARARLAPSSPDTRGRSPDADAARNVRISSFNGSASSIGSISVESRSPKSAPASAVRSAPPPAARASSAAVSRGDFLHEQRLPLVVVEGDVRVLAEHADLAHLRERHAARRHVRHAARREGEARVRDVLAPAEHRHADRPTPRSAPPPPGGARCRGRGSSGPSRRRRRTTGT